MFLRDDLDRCQGLKVSVVPVSVAVVLREHEQRAAISGEAGAYLSLALGRVEAGTRFNGVINRTVATSEESTANCNRYPQSVVCPSEEREIVRTWVELIEGNPILPHTREELWLDVAMDSIIDALVRCGHDIPVGLANLADLGNLPRHVVADTKPFEFALLIEVVHRLKSDFIWCCTVGSVQIPHLYRSGCKRYVRRSYERGGGGDILGLESLQ